MQLAKTYRIETDRLVIRCYHPGDAELLKSTIDQNIEHLSPWMPWAHQEPETVEQKRLRLRKYRGQFDLGEDYTFGIFDRGENEIIGSTGMHTRAGVKAREIGYWISKHHINKGYATETTKALIKIGFEIEELERIEIRCGIDNSKSHRIPKKLGFTYEGTVHHNEIDSGMNVDMMIWTMQRKEYFVGPLRSTNVHAFDLLDQPIQF